MADAAGLHVGNAYDDAPRHRGWLLGHFVADVGSPLHSEDLEVKWDVHDAGERRATWVEEEERTALCVLVRGRLRLSFPSRDVVLSREGDYVVWRRLAHSWSVEEDVVALVVRWPSMPGYDNAP